MKTTLESRMRAAVNKSSVDLTPEVKTLLILGDGRSLDDDIKRFNGQEADIATIGRSIKKADNAKHWFNADGGTSIAWAKQLKDSMPGLITHSLGEIEGFDVDWEVEQPDYNYGKMTNEYRRLHGSSAMFAVLAGLAMGYEEIILAGCPLDMDGHWYFEPDKPETLGPLWIGVDFMAWIDFSRTKDAKKVESLSGYTAKILGGKNGE